MAPLLLKSGANDRALAELALDGVVEQLRGAFGRIAGPVRKKIGELAVTAITGSPEYASLLTGTLRGELGVVAAEPVLRQVCKNIAEGVLVTVTGPRRVGTRTEGGLRIEILKGDYSEVLGVPGASFTSEGGYEIDWLRWLTLEGDQIIVADYHFAAGFPDRSRTGLGVMRPTGSWRVPAEFSGTKGDNWLTRALGALGPSIESVIQQELARAL